MTGEEISVLRTFTSNFISTQSTTHNEDSSSSSSSRTSLLTTSPSGSAIQLSARTESPPSSPSYHELRTVSNAYGRSLPSAFGYQQTAAVTPWSTCASSPDLRRSVDLGLSGSDLSIYGSSDRFSNFLNISSDSMGSFKVGSNGELLLDRDSLKGSSIIGSHNTLESGYGSTFLSSLLNDQHQLGSLKELSHTEVADTLLSLKHSRMKIGNQQEPTAAFAPANPGVNQPYQLSELTSSTGSMTANIGGPDPCSILRNQRYHGLEYDNDRNSASNLSFPGSASSLDCAAYLGNYWLREHHLDSGSGASSHHFITSSGDLPPKALGLPDGYDPSHSLETAYWAFTQSTPNVFESSQGQYNSFGNTSDFHANSPGSSAKLYSVAPVAAVKSADELNVHSSAPVTLAASSRSSVASVGSNSDGLRPDLSSASSSLLLPKFSGNSLQLHRCQFCDKDFTRPGALKTHTKIHFGQKQYVCNVCSKGFFQAANLKAHMRVHSGEKPFSCKVCGKGFSQSSSVKTHLRTHSGERPYTCKLCNKSFSDNSTLTKHQRIHSGHKPYNCTYCRQSFSQSGNLSRHMKIHKKVQD